MISYPKAFEDLTEDFKLLPGIGDKTSERFVYALNEVNKEAIEKFSQDLLNFKTNIKSCNVCGIITENNVCELCNSSSNRNKEIICVVEDSKNAFLFEKSGNYNGLYHILNGLINPIEDINPEDINLLSLVKRLDENVKEIIIALSPSIEGETTSLYIQKILENKGIKVSRLSYGIPMGSDIEYLDPIMISKALEDRKYIE